MRDEMLKGAIEQFMRSNPEPWRGHPETCKWHPRPNLVTVYRRAGFLWLRKVMGGNCTGCDWRVEGWQWVALTNWNNLAADDAAHIDGGEGAGRESTSGRPPTADQPMASPLGTDHIDGRDDG